MKKMNFHTLSDGNNTEGIGALLQYQMFCYGYCILNESSFCFDGFKNLQHFQYTNQSQEEFSETLSKFCGLPVNKIPNDSNYMDPSFVMKFGQQNIEKIVPILQNIEIRRITPSYFNSNKLNVAVHFRVFTKTDNDLSPVREYFNLSNLNDHLHYYEKVVDKIKKLYGNKNIVYHIYSQGSPTQFKNIENIFCGNIEYHLDEHPIISLQHMIDSDVLVMANSSLSYVAHLYGRTKCIAKPTFYHSLYKPNIL